ncbi:hypothetical protein [Velocimicrobium porci]|nr:hypothetical protein [Velocimicrobium porci]
MGKSVKSKIARKLAGNTDLNKKALQVKKSWDEVSSIINSGKKSVK